LERLVAALAQTDSQLAAGRRLTVNAAGRKMEPHPDFLYHSEIWLPPTSVLHGLEAAREVGGWQFPESGSTRDAETDLWARITARFGPPIVIDNLTCIKFPAAQRPKVYQQRPCHEQRDWLRILRETDDAELHVRRLAQEPIEPTDHDRAIVESWPAAMRGLPSTAAERYRSYREFKGLPSRPYGGENPRTDLSR
jgi:hypothetical protein